MSKHAVLYDEDLPGEEWASAYGYDGLYEVSNMGRVKSLSRYVERPQGSYYTKVRILHPGSSEWRTIDGRVGRGAIFFLTDESGHRKMRTLASLVLDAFVGPQEGCEAHHLNCNSSDNRLSNLQWLSGTEKRTVDYENGLRENSRVACARLGGYRRAILTR